ncbi:MAG TPA: cytochrome b [Gammaproteobacteria bacterium]|nr:cytochrome b [Gammaproteobacteria bacterium]
MARHTAAAYGSAAKFLHWLMAAWIVTAYAVIIWLTWDHTEGLIPGLNYHKVVGFTILVPFIVRVVWRLRSGAPALPHGMPRWQARLSRLTHLALYFLMIAMPVTGYLGNFGGVDYGIFRVPPFARTELARWIFATFGVTPEQWDVFFDTFHYRIVGPYIFPTVVALHVGAAVYHHVVLKDNVLRRMLPGKREPSAAWSRART